MKDQITKTIDSMTRTVETLENQFKKPMASSLIEESFTLSSDLLIEVISNLMEHAEP